MLKPLDVTVMAMILTTREERWTQSTLAQELGIAQSNVHRAIRQLERSGLIKARLPQRAVFVGLLKHAVRYVYPAELGPPARGIPTAHAGPGVDSKVASSVKYVWPYDEGGAFGPSIIPLYPSIPMAASRNPRFYELMSLLDVFRIGKVREQEIAEEELRRLLRETSLLSKSA